MRNEALFATGLLMGAANTVRHRRQGYVSPRPFDADDVARTIDHAIEIVDRLEHRGSIDWNGKRVLELGPGSDLTTGAVMLHRGAASYQAIDAFDNLNQAHPDLYERLGAHLNAPVPVDRLGFSVVSFPELDGVSGEFDVIVSNATLEHVRGVGYVFRALRQLASTGGKMVHHIDAQTHMRWIKDADPLNILRYPDPLYRALLDFPGAPNRLRASDYEHLAQLHGWQRTEIIAGRRADDGYIARTRVARRFRRYDDLALLTFTLVATAGASAT